MGTTARRHLSAGLQRALRSEDGSATLEFILWVPVIMAILLFAADVSLFFANTGRVTDAARDVTRRLSLGQLAVAEAEAYVAEHLPASFAVAVDVDETVASDVRVNISVPYASISPLGTISAFRSGDFVFSYVMYREVAAGS